MFLSWVCEVARTADKSGRGQGNNSTKALSLQLRSTAPEGLALILLLYEALVPFGDLIRNIALHSHVQAVFFPQRAVALICLRQTASSRGTAQTKNRGHHKVTSIFGPGVIIWFSYRIQKPNQSPAKRV